MTILEALSYLEKANYEKTRSCDIFKSTNYNTDYLQARFAADDSFVKYIILAEYDPLSGVDWYVTFTMDLEKTYIRYEVVSNSNEVLHQCTFNFPMTEESFFQESVVQDYQNLTFEAAIELPKYFTATRQQQRLYG